MMSGSSQFLMRFQEIIKVPMLAFLFLYFSECRPYGIFNKTYDDNLIIANVSGNGYEYKRKNPQQTKIDYAIDGTNCHIDWCPTSDIKNMTLPWVAFSLINRSMSVEGYFFRTGCCYGGCCVERLSSCTVCCMTSWELQMSDNFKDWTTVHSVSKGPIIEYCTERNYTFEKSYFAKYFRFYQTEPCTGKQSCISFQKIELFGNVIYDLDEKTDIDALTYHEDDEDVSVIGHISKRI